ncbi:class I SAM-dependent methyltransferase [Parabacteroides sp. APC149_11_2_Y6]
MKYQCSICNNTQNNTSFTAREMMFGTRDEFTYFKCPVCGCLQIADIPDNLDKYYPDNYYSYQQKKTSGLDTVTNSLIRISIGLRLDKILPVHYLSSKYRKYHQYHKLWLKDCYKNAPILDIGCGKGTLLKLLHIYGFKNLTGIDPFINENFSYKNGINIYKKDIFSLDRQYDLVMFHHAFEHMPDPHQVFSQLNKIVTNNGRILIRIPVADGYAWRKYRMDWFQVDAPRHLFLHTVNSIALLAEKHELAIESIHYDSKYHQIAISEQYARNIPASQMPKLSLKEKCAFKKKAKELNSLHDGDQACFILKKKI